MGITMSAPKELRSHLSFTQLRFHCSKKQGRTFHMITVNNSTGEPVVQFFSGQKDVLPDSCGSYKRMEDDDSKLAMECESWNYEGKFWRFSFEKYHVHICCICSREVSLGSISRKLVLR